MKILILSPYDIDNFRRDLKLLNFKQDVYSSFYVFEMLFIDAFKRGEDFDAVSTILGIAETLNEKEYNSSQIHYGPVPRSYHFDRIIVYDYDVVSTQEAALISSSDEFKKTFYTTDDATDVVTNIMEAIILVGQLTNKDNSEPEVPHYS